MVLESGQGMGATLLMASEKKGYTLSDRATYLAEKPNTTLNILCEGDSSLLNIYHVMEVNPEKFGKVNAEGAKAFVDFMTSPETQKLIGDFGKDRYGQPLFFPTQTNRHNPIVQWKDCLRPASRAFWACQYFWALFVISYLT